MGAVGEEDAELCWPLQGWTRDTAGAVGTAELDTEHSEPLLAVQAGWVMCPARVTGWGPAWTTRVVSIP